MPCYIVALINIHDRDTYSKYEAGFMDVFEQFNGTMLSVDEEPQVIEGDWSWTRTVLISFPSNADAQAWYQSAAYQEIAKHRYAASNSQVVFLNGISVTN
ncbi:MAG: DUF1330 domain-containing protein [Pseudomonadota bacterium]